MNVQSNTIYCSWEDMEALCSKSCYDFTTFTVIDCAVLIRVCEVIPRFSLKLDRESERGGASSVKPVGYLI